MKRRNAKGRSAHIAVAYLLAAAAALLWGRCGLAAQLPVPCVAGSCSAYSNGTKGFSQPAGFVTYGQATAAQSGNTLTVSQSSSQAILNWSSFNIGAGGQVVFQQPSATSIALNKIYQASPSSIFGVLTANGQVYLINPNGFVFGSTASVNVAGLMASSLDTYGDIVGGAPQEVQELTSGILSEISSASPALQSDGRVYVTDASGNLVLDAQGNPEPVQVVVQQGAQISAASGGRILLAGQQVSNSGTLTAPDGQIVLAAGQTVYLQASNDPSLRGLVVEVSNTANGATTPAATGVGTVSNQAGGTLSTPEGNVSLIGLAVNQSGRISATTSVSANGSVILEAGQGQAFLSENDCSDGNQTCTTQGGTVTLGATSEIDVLPDLSDTTTAAVAQPQQQSSVQLTGEQVYIDGGQINAPGGTLNVLAAADPNAGLSTEGNTAAQIRVASGTSIDLAGSDAVLPMSANLLTIQLRGTELEDDPDQRGGALEGQTVVVDTRDGEPPIVSAAAWDADLQGVQENIAQRTSEGGSASFQSEGDIVVGSGATINVSGGEWTYEPGIVQTSQLIASNGKMYDIDTASPLLDYVGVLNPTYTQSYSGFGVQITSPTPGLSQSEPGYVEGFSAGTVSFAAPAMSLQGTLKGTAVNGPYQRSGATIPATSLAAVIADGGDIPTSGAVAMASGGTLIIGDPAGGGSSSFPAFFAPAVTFASSAPAVDVPDGTPLTPGTLDLPISYITGSGFQNTEIFSDSSVTLPGGLPLNLGAGGSLLVVAPQITIGSGIQALGGSINLESAETADFESAGLGRPGIDIENGVTLNVSGQWTNDSTDAPATAETATYQNGGTIVLSLAPNSSDLPANILSNGSSSLSPLTSGGELVLGNNVSLLASGGAWMQYTNSVVGGTGGSITIDASPYQSALQVGSNTTLAAFGVEGAAGGSFTLEAPELALVPGNSWTGAQSIDELQNPGSVFDVGASLFSQYGFTDVNLTATGPEQANAVSSDVLTVTSGTQIDAEAQSLELSSSFFTHPSGGTVQGFTKPELLPPSDQTPYSITLQVVPAISDPATTVIGDLDVEAGSSIVAGPGASAGSSISLVGQGSIVVDGVLRAPGGTLSLQIPQPTTLTDPGYLPGQEIELGPETVLDVSGTAVMTPNLLNLPLGTVLPGGTVSLIADRGEIVVDPGSLIDIAGGSAVLDVDAEGGAGGYRSATMGSAGGTLIAQSIESISLLGSLSAGGGASSAGTVEGGTLEVDLNVVPPSDAIANPFPYSTTPYTIELVSSVSCSASLSSCPALSAPSADTAVLGIAQLEQSGIGSLELTAGSTVDVGGVPTMSGTIDFAGNTTLSLSLPQEISLDTPNIGVSGGASVSLSAPYVVLTDSLVNNEVATPEGSAGTGSLSVTAQEIALSGYTALQGVQDMTLASSGDVQLEPLSGAELTGELSLEGNLTIDAARVYPATFASYTINDPSGTVQIAPPPGETTASQSPMIPLSAGGALTIDAENIASSGTLLAPFGQIALNATNSLDLQSGSITSVSADGAVLPYGQTTLGEAEWIYQAGSATIPVTGVPTKQVTLSAPEVTVASGATIDVSGGGDLTAYEWVPGLGGSVDALGQANASAAGLYAVLPSTAGQYAAYDLQEFTGSNASVGESVYLSGVEGLPAGTYALLPARYALLPGAYLIEVEPSYQSLTPGVIGALADDTPVVAGYLTFGDTGLRSASGYTGFAVWPGSYSQSLAQYDISYASSFFGSGAGAGESVTLPADAGSLTVAVGSALYMDGNVNTTAGAGGSAGTIDIYTTGPSDITVTADNSQTSSDGGISIGAPVIQSWNAGDLILGGELAPQSAGGSTSIDVTANDVTIDSGAELSAQQLLIVANQSINVDSGATLASDSGLTGTALKSLPASSSIDIGNDAAMLALSDESLPIASRSGVQSGGGSISIAPGATLETRGALALDAPGSVQIAGNIDAPGASWSLASSSIAFVGSGASSSDTLQIGSVLLADLQTAGAIRLASATTIDLLTPVSLGATSGASTPTLQSLSLVAASINNSGGDGSVFGAQTLSLQGVGPSAETPTSGSNSLTLVAGQLDVGSGYLAVNGDAQTTLQATGAVVGQGTGQLSLSGNVAITAPLLTAAGQSAAAIDVPEGSLQVSQSGAAPAPSSLTASLGGGLTLSAGSIDDAGSIIVPGGQVALQATSNLTLSSGALIDVAGTPVSAMSETVGAAGGIVDISAGGDLTLPSGATIDVAGAPGSSPAGNAPAGFLNISGGGTVTLDATLIGNAPAGQTGGSFSLYAGQLAGGLSPALVDELTTGGFSSSIGIEVASGDLDLAQSGCASNAVCTLTASQITLTSDAGSIDIAGTLSAPSANLRGSIGLFANDNVVLEPTGELLANGNATNGNGGDIEVSTVAGSITLDSGSAISATAAGVGEAGTLLLRAPEVNEDDVAINSIGSNVSGVGSITIEPVLPTFEYDQIGDFTTNFTPIQTAVTDYLSSASSTILGRLGIAGGPAMTIEPGVVVEASGSDGNIVLSSPLDLYAELGTPIDLTVLASGSITINGTISDGFTDGVTGVTLAPQSYQSSTLRFVAGANLQSADPLATVAAGTGGSLILGQTLGQNGQSGPVLVRTGTGDIDLVASNDVELENGSSAYTTGYSGATPVSVKLSSGTVPMNFPTGGGNVVVSAGQDVVGTALEGSASDWEVRTTTSSATGEWGLNVAAFDKNPWSVATFGGGDLSITSGGDVVNVTAAASDSMPSSAQTPFTSGGLSVDAQGSVTGGQFFLADGAGTVSAGGAIGVSATSSGTSSAAGSLFWLEDSELSLWAEGNITVAGIINPTIVFQPQAPAGTPAYFLTYGANSEFSAQSTSGDVTVSNSSQTINQIVGTTDGEHTESADQGFSLFPATLNLVSLTQNLELSGATATLSPSDDGQLQLFAGLDIVGGRLLMSDAPEGYYPTPSDTTLGNVGLQSIAATSGSPYDFFGNLHANDPVPASIVAGVDIEGLSLSIPKPSDIEAGQDIENLDYEGENLNANQVTLIYAGQDLADPLSFGASGLVTIPNDIINVGGPGALDILAGRNIDLGFGLGVTTSGNLENGNLPTGTGANITMMAGLGQSPDYANFLQTIVDPSATYQQELLSYVESMTGQSGLSAGQAETEFASFSEEQQAPFIDGVFFNELNASGIAANKTPGAGYTEGYAAIQALFPGSPTGSASDAANPYSGDLDLTYSQIYTQDGGDITLLVPGGDINVGLANPPSAITEVKPPSRLGIVAQGPGNVDIYSLGDVNVNSSRIFTLGGGNILIWSQQGSIDAGNGAKSSLSLPPPTITYDSNGIPYLTYDAAVAGSGIRTIQSTLTVPAGNVNLIAPVGTVNAGDAGIGAAGDINIAAVSVVGAANINFGGTATGVPALVSNVTASVSGSASAASGATTSVTSSLDQSNANTQQAPLAQAALSWLDVFVTGLGVQNCAPADAACLNREQHQ